MNDPENEVYFCICGKKVENQGSCGESICIDDYEAFQDKIDNFFTLMESQGLWVGYQVFEQMDLQLQIGILFELEDELMLLFLQSLGQEKVLELLQFKSDAFRYRFLELIGPLLEENLVKEYKDIQEFDKDELKEFLLQIIDIILQSVEKIE